MKILWFTWKDLKNPLAGGAEVVNEELARRLVKDGHKVTLIVGGFKGGQAEELINGYKIIRIGNRFSVYWHAYRYYKKHFASENKKFDLVIDEMNTIPFFAKLYVREPVILFVHQLARVIWFYEMRFPLSLVGYLLEPLYLWLLSASRVITVSESTRQDLMRYGFRETNITVISEGIELEPVNDPSKVQKFESQTLLSLGAIRSMKRTGDIVKAFELAKRDLPALKLIVAGSAESEYGKKVLSLIENSPFREDISYEGRVSKERKVELMQKAHAIAVTSVKEGWGLIVTEAASQGTSAVVYNVDGLRDSVKNGVTGLIASENTPAMLAEALASLLSNTAKYEYIQKNALEWSKEISFSNSYADLSQILKSHI